MILILVLLVTVVSGATDAPNAIATALSTRCMKPGTAIGLAAVFNFIGLVGMCFISTAVASTMFGMVNFNLEGVLQDVASHAALMSLIAAMFAAIFWGAFCWALGIPASKSHSLIAGITGAAIAINGFKGVVPLEWVKVIYGMLFSLFFSFVAGWCLVKLLKLVCWNLPRKETNSVFKWIQNVLAICLSSLHGAQDGQKFIAIAMLGITLANGQTAASNVSFPIWLMLICSLAMSLGTAIGGKRIIKSVAMDMVKLEKYQGAAAGLSASLCLLVACLTGMPISTSHASTSAIMGVGTEKNPRQVKWGVAFNMVKAWIFTFPCCGVIGFVLAKIFMFF
ncbi:MAG: inorganic phosphate transporter [Eggerthellaceae bacterium]|nr:inorganic phosphate transporter [Eggerthellaceae bacterium]